MTDATLYQTCAALLAGAAALALGFRASHWLDARKAARWEAKATSSQLRLVARREALKAKIAALKLHDNRRAALGRELRDVTRQELELRRAGRLRAAQSHNSAPAGWRGAR